MAVYLFNFFCSLPALISQLFLGYENCLKQLSFFARKYKKGALFEKKRRSWGRIWKKIFNILYRKYVLKQYPDNQSGSQNQPSYSIFQSSSWKKPTIQFSNNSGVSPSLKNNLWYFFTYFWKYKCITSDFAKISKIKYFT